MKTYRVHENNLHIKHQFELIGDFLPGVEEKITHTLDLFYHIAGKLFPVDSTKIYIVHVDQKGGNKFTHNDHIYFSPVRLTEWTIVHEMGHALDASYGWKLSQRMRVELKSYFPVKALHKAFPKWRMFWYRVGSPPPPCGVNDKFNSLEDFAETVTAYIFPEAAKRKAEDSGYAYEKWGYGHFYETPRGRYFQQLLDEKQKEAPSN